MFAKKMSKKAMKEEMGEPGYKAMPKKKMVSKKPSKAKKGKK